MKTCKFCSRLIGSDKRTDSKFCSNSCKARYHDNHASKGFSIKPKSERHDTNRISQPSNDRALGGLLQQQQENEQAAADKAKPQQAERPYLEPPRNVLSGKISEGGTTEQKPSEKRQKIEPLPLPPEYLNLKETVPNPLYPEVKQRFNTQVQAMERIKNANVELVNKLKEVESDDGNGAIGLGAVTGGSLGYYLMEKEGAKNKPKSNDSLQKILGVVGFAALGAWLGYAFKIETTASREQRKKAEMDSLQKRIGNNKFQLILMDGSRKKNEEELKRTPQFVSIEKKVKNPDYDTIKEANRLAALNNEALEREAAQQSGMAGMEQADIRETENIRSAKKMMNEEMQVFDFSGVWLDFLGQPETDFFCVIHGLSGAGKSHFAIQLAKYLAENHGYVLYVSSEEGFSATMKKKVFEMAATIEGFYFSDLSSGEQVLNEVPDLYHFIILDSLNNMKIDPEQMNALRAKFDRSAFIAVCQSTKKDDIRGSYEIVHDADTVIKVSEGTATTTKNRFTNGERVFDVFAALNNQDKGDTKIIPFKGNKQHGKKNDDDDEPEISSTI